MATRIEKWVSFDDDEGGGEEEEEEEEDHEDALSLSDFPMVVDSGETNNSNSLPCTPQLDPQDAEEFEFRAFGGSGVGGGNPSSNPDDSFLVDMCAADEVFFQGQILPMRPSSACSRSESMDRCSSANGSSLRFDSSSIGTISRSHSTDSSASHSSTGSAADAPPRLSVSSNFYAGHPSPRPQLSARKTTAGPRRKSTSGSGGPAMLGLLRLGVVRAPEMELRELRQARKGGIGNGSSRWSRTEERKPEKKKAEAMEKGGSRGSSTKDAMRLFGSKLSCKCSPDDAVEPIISSSSSSSSRPLIDNRRKKKDESEGSVPQRRRDEPTSCRSSRTFQWLEDLHITKVTSSEYPCDGRRRRCLNPN